jgi:tryptophan synthase beta subunit
VLQVVIKEAVDSAFESYLKDYKNSIYCIGSALGPHPFPMIVRDFQSVIGIEAREQYKEMTGELPDVVCACVGGGSNSLGMFIPFLNDPVQIVGIEPLGKNAKKEIMPQALPLARKELCMVSIQ